MDASTRLVRRKRLTELALQDHAERESEVSEWDARCRTRERLSAARCC
jgi:hypothetical protein